MTYQRLGVKHKRWWTGPNNRGPAEVHETIWRRDIRQWVLTCLFDREGIHHGRAVPDDEPITCERCLARMAP